MVNGALFLVAEIYSVDYYILADHEAEAENSWWTKAICPQLLTQDSHVSHSTNFGHPETAALTWCSAITTGFHAQTVVIRISVLSMNHAAHPELLIYISIYGSFRD